MGKIKKHIYLDAAATASSSQFNVSDDFANPNSVHDSGRDAFAVLEEARETITHAIGAKRPGEIVFTSGATEANNMAIFGIARAVRAAKIGSQNNSQKNKSSAGCAPSFKVLVSSVEHESAFIPALELVNECFDVQEIPVNSNGKIQLDAYKNMLTDNTVLVIVQHASSETGVVQDIATLSQLAHEQGAFFHSDMVGSFGRIPIDVCKLSVDSASFSGHKIGAPKGIGVMYLKAKTPFKPLIFGSGQEKGMRGGTQSVALAAAMADATNYAIRNMDSQTQKYLQLKTFLFENLKHMDNVQITVPDAELPNVVHLLFKGKDSEDLILYYGKHSIEVSGGPACSSQDKEPSHTLLAMGIPENEANGAVRLSFSADTTFDDIKAFVQATKEL